MLLSLIELSFSTTENKVKKKTTLKIRLCYFEWQKNLLKKKPIGKKLPEVSKRIFPRREKNSWKLHFISIIAHFFHWIFFCIFVMYYSEAIFLVTQSKQIRLFGLQLNVYSRHSFSIWNGKNGRREREKKEWWFCLKQMHIHAKSRYLFSHVIQIMYNCSIECYFFSS